MSSTEQPVELQGWILIINTFFTFITPIMYMILKMIKRCQLGRNTFIETRSDNSPPSSATRATPLFRLQSLFSRNNTGPDPPSEIQPPN